MQLEVNNNNRTFAQAHIPDTATSSCRSTIIDMTISTHIKLSMIKE